MFTRSATTSQPARAARLAAMVGLLALGTTGCQTFNLTADQFERQQRGEMVNREVGAAVGAAGTLGYYGATLGAALATAVHH